MKQRFVKAMVIAGVMGAVAMVQPVSAGETDAAKTKYKTVGGGVGQAIKVTATVVAIDKANHLVSLKGPEGRVVDVHAPEARNLDQVAVGDKVNAVYYESIALFLGKPGEKPQIDATVAGARSEYGDLPAGAVERSVDVSATIEAIDKPNRKVTLKGPDGSVKTVTVPKEMTLEKVKTGDTVHARYTQALALELNKT